MGMPVKVSNTLVTAALSHADVLALKSVVVDAPEAGLPELESLLERLRAVIQRVVHSPDRSTVLAELWALGTPLHEGAGDGKHVIRVEADGTRTVGRFEQGQFLPGDEVGVGR